MRRLLLLCLAACIKLKAACTMTPASTMCSTAACMHACIGCGVPVARLYSEARPRVAQQLVCVQHTLRQRVVLYQSPKGTMNEPGTRPCAAHQSADANMCGFGAVHA